MTVEQFRNGQLTYDDLWVNHFASALVFLIPFGVVIFTLLSAKVKPEFVAEVVAG